jgi:uncharacterized protein YndB with AHSA1/START domain/uncharacterized protein YciI
MTDMTPLRREILVAASRETAFTLFTAHIGAWWPQSDFSVYGGLGSVAFEGDRVVERHGADESVWAEVTAWNPPERLALSWHPGNDPSKATDVHISFTEVAAGTRVVLEHSGWERTAAPEAARTEYGNGWPIVLTRFKGRVEPARRTGAGAAQPRWFALVHRAARELSAGEGVFSQPDFAEHAAFLKRLAERGLLVAAGPLLDEAGSGMAVVRVADPELDVSELARTDDQSVIRGLIEVEVKPWDVRLTG